MIYLDFSRFLSGLDLNFEFMIYGVNCVFTQRATLNHGKLVYSQLMAFLPLSTFRRCVATQNGDHKFHDFTCLDQLAVMAFAQQPS